jgi:hypothetical protein
MMQNIRRFKNRKQNLNINMKREIELVKLILEYFENKDDWRGENEIQINGYTKNIVDYHIQILFEAGLLNAEPTFSKNGRLYDALPFRLTWQGHEFLDNIKDKPRWMKMKKIVEEKGGSFSVELIKTLAFKLAEQQLLGG